jgi:hypothetical protein
MKQLYIITYNNRKYPVTIDVHSSKYVVRFGEGVTCVYITIYRKIPLEHISNDSKAIAQLEGLTYDVACNLDNNHKKGSGTKEILTVAALFIKKRFPYVTSFRFQDTSYQVSSFQDTSKLYCKGNIVVSLYYTSLLKYGKTWYQENFNATCLDGRLIKNISKFNNELSKDIKGTFDEFWKDHISGSLKYMKGTKIDNMYNGMREAYNSSNTWREFFTYLTSVDCKVFQHWLNRYMRSVHDLNFEDVEWIIDLDTICANKGDIIIEKDRQKPTKTPSNANLIGGNTLHPNNMNFGRYDPRYF